MNDTISLTRRYARPMRPYFSFVTYDMLADVESSQSSTGNNSHLRLVVSNETLPKIFSPRYHTGD